MMRILLFLLSAVSTAAAQSLTPAGVAPLNQQLTSSGYQLTATLGLPAYSHYGANNYLLTEGLQQPMLHYASAPAVTSPRLRVYPNPAHEALFVEYPEALHTQVLDLTGRIVATPEPILVTEGQWRLSLDDFAVGPYLLRLSTVSNQVFIYKIILY